MRSEGVELLAHVRELDVMGFSGLPHALPRLARLKASILRRCRARGVELAMLVDYPGFNLNLAKALKRLPHPPRILYYIAPQTWAWHGRRTRSMRRVIDRLAVVFPFEVEFFTRAGVPATFVGHPLLDELEPVGSGRAFRTAGPLLALLPGSRTGVVRRHLPPMVSAAKRLRERMPELRAAVGCAPGLDERLYRYALDGDEWIELRASSRELLAEADAALVCSGTATLEAALLQTPQAVVYRTSPLNYRIIKRLIKIERVALVNVIAGREVVPELLQGGFTPRTAAQAVEKLLRDEHHRARMADDYREVCARLGTPGAAARVAAIATEMLK